MTSPAAPAGIPTVSVAPMELQRYAADPLHVQIEAALRDNIVSRRWAPRSKLPPEPELAALLGVNRGTLRRAIGSLVASGLLISIRGRGTFVAAAPDSLSLAQRFESLSEEFAAQGVAVTREVLSATVVAAPGHVINFLMPGASEGAGAGTETGRDPDQTLQLIRVFHGDDGPLAYVANYVATADFPGIADCDFAREALFTILATRYDTAIVRGQRTFRAQPASATVALALDLAPGAPVLHLAQTTFTHGNRAIEYSDVWINSERVAITSFLQRDEPNPPAN